MLERIIRLSIANRWLVLTTAALSAASARTTQR